MQIQNLVQYTLEENSFQKHFQSWLFGLRSEVMFWAKQAWKVGLKDDIDQRVCLQAPRDCGNYVDLGCGGHYFTTKERSATQYHLIDPLAMFYNKIHAFGPCESDIPIQFGIGEFLSSTIPPETADIIHVSNALDHTFDPIKCIYEMLNACRVGGYIHMVHQCWEAKRANYSGLHQVSNLVCRHNF